MKHKVFIVGTGLMITAFFLGFIGGIQFIGGDIFDFSTLFKFNDQESFMVLFKLSVILAIISGIIVTYDLLVDAYRDIKGFVLKKFKNR